MSLRWNMVAGWDAERGSYMDAATADRVTDFATGAGGDVIDLGSMFYWLHPYDMMNDPFTTGHLRFQQSGSHSRLQANLDATGTDWLDVLVLENVNASAITAANVQIWWLGNSGQAPVLPSISSHTRLEDAGLWRAAQRDRCDDGAWQPWNADGAKHADAARHSPFQEEW